MASSGRRVRVNLIDQIRAEVASLREAKAKEWGVPVGRVKVRYVSGGPGSFVFDCELLPDESGANLRS